MPRATVDTETLRRLLKETVAEALHEERELLHDVFVEVLEDIALGEAMREGMETERVDRQEIFDLLERRE